MTDWLIYVEILTKKNKKQFLILAFNEIFTENLDLVFGITYVMPVLSSTDFDRYQDW